jgi:asparagine synthase (glutamine-hydrolysing)
MVEAAIRHKNYRHGSLDFGGRFAFTAGVCGICGVVSLEGELNPAVARSVQAMSDALRHRGPDGGSAYHAGWAALGHRRLAIIDRAGGEQPMANEDGHVWIVFNGEVYNHHELRRTLTARGHQFRSRSDTEAVIHAYEEFGDSCVDHFDGMFAFAIADLRKRRVLLARDRLGKKPLFYGVFDGVLHFGSEIKSLKASPLWRGDVDLNSLEGYLSLGYFLAPGTAYAHVRKLEPGHTLSVEGSRLAAHQYWDVDCFDTDTRTTDALVDELEGRLATAVSQRLESEVPIGAFLSGGIDSGLVVSHMADALGSPPITTSVGFDEAAHNELRAAGLTASHCATRHTAAVVHPRLDDVLDPIVQAFDEPFADPSAIPTYYVSRMAREHVTVALSGDGGDEAFGGYDFRYGPHALEERARRFMPGRPGRVAASWLGARWPRSRAWPRPFRLGNVLENLGREPADAYYADLCFLKPADARALLGRAPTRTPADSPVYEAVTAPYRRCRSRSAVQRAQYADLKVYMPNDPLVKVDRMSMAHSLEIRCPLLDHHLVEFAFRIPTERKMPNRQPKSLLRRLAARRLPDGVVRGPKHGFTAPIGSWMAGPYAEQFRSDVLSTESRARTILDLSLVRRLFDEHRAGRTDHSFPLWAVWMLERWARAEPVAVA